MINKAKLLKRSMIAVLLLFIGFAGGTFFGMGSMVSYETITKNVPEGLLASAQLLQLEKGNSAPIKMDLESHVDMALADYSYAQDRWWFPLYENGWSLVSPQDVDTWLHHIANYRKHHPSPYREAYANVPEKLKQTPDYKESVASNRDYWKRIDAMVETFADK